MMTPMSGPPPGDAAAGEAGRDPEILPASDRTLLVSFGERIEREGHENVLRLLGLLDAEPPAGVVDLSPAYASILLRFDPRTTDHERLGDEVRRRLGRLGTAPPTEGRLVEIPVCYGGELGPDLEEVARFAGIPPEDAAARHAEQIYKVFFLGFSPGFAYMGIVPEAIACPRLAQPRRLVPAGSVGIAGSQTGVYPFATPGGWRIVGRTPLAMFDAARDPMSRLQIADRVRFVPIDEDRYKELAS